MHCVLGNVMHFTSKYYKKNDMFDRGNIKVWICQIPHIYFRLAGRHGSITQFQVCHILHIYSRMARRNGGLSLNNNCYFSITQSKVVSIILSSIEFPHIRINEHDLLKFTFKYIVMMHIHCIEIFIWIFCVNMNMSTSQGTFSVKRGFV